MGERTDEDRMNRIEPPGAAAATTRAIRKAPRKCAVKATEMVLGGGDQAFGGRLVGVVSGDPYHPVVAAQRGGGLLHFGAPARQDDACIFGEQGLSRS
jgi:hypothetical protein